MNYRLLLQYDGTDFHGWQMQSELRTVQGELTRVLSLLDGREVVVHGSGRTDAGVHAEGQVANVQLQREISPLKLRSAINGNLSPDARVLFVDVVPDDFHARYSAKSKRYSYRLVHGTGDVAVLAALCASGIARPRSRRDATVCSIVFGRTRLDGIFCGPGRFRNARAERYRVDYFGWLGRTAGHCHLIEFTISANGFLRYMARSIVGTLLAVGRQRDRRRRQWLEQSRAVSVRWPGATAPANGLTLVSVQYD